MGSKKKNDMKKNKKSKNKNKDVIDNPSLITEKTSIGHDRDKKKIITDARFSSVHSDPRFQNVPKHKAKVTIDSRFDRMFSDKSFAASSAPLDKRGKPKKKNSKNLLRHYYKVEEEKEKDENDSEEGEESDSDGIEIEKKNQVLEKPNSSNELEESESESESEDDDDAETGESDYTTDTDEGEMEENYDYETPELPVENIPEIDKETRRLAIVNLDWRHVKAEDLYVVLSSFLPKGGQILSVAVYPSEFGLERMKEEELRGPVGLFDDEQEKNDEDEDEDEDGELDNEKLRAYELSRLRYYYAVVECDSIATADYLYKTCDGVEFERSSNVLDLRFIPDSMEFKHAPRDIATEAPSSYEVLNFHTSALQHSKINLSWDEDEPQRVRALKRKFNEDQLAELEFKEFLASDESESDDGEEDQIDKKCKKGDKYRALLQSDENDKQEDDQDMEVTFNTGLEDISERILAKKDKKSESLWDAYLRKKREKKKAGKNKSTYSSEDESSDTDREVVEQADDFFIEEPSVKSNRKDQSKNIKDEEHVDREAETSRAELELLLADDQGVNTGPKGYNLKQYQKKAKKKGKEDLAEDKIPTVDYDDARFSALFTSPLFALDPTDPQFKRSAAYVRQATLNQPKGGRDELMKSTKQSDEANNDVPVKTEGSSSKEKLELSSLVKSIKMKSKQLQLPSDGKRSNKDRKQHNRGMEEREGKRESPSTIKSVEKKKRKTKDMAD